MMKMTYVDALEIAISKLSEDDTFSTYLHNVHEVGDCVETKHSMRAVIDKLTALRDQQMKRNTSEKKPTKTQQANEDIKVRMVEAMTGRDQMTVTDIQGLNDEFKAMTNQKVAALVRQLVKDGKLVRIEEGRKAYFKVA